MKLNLVHPCLPLLGVLCLSPAPAPAASASATEFHEVLRQKPDPVHGAELFRTCSVCHGVDGGGVPDGSVPAIAGQYFRVIVRQLVDFRHDQRWDIRMEHFVDKHRLPAPKDLADVADHVSHMPRQSHPGTGPGEAVEHGRSIYLQKCEACHGPLAEGDEHHLVPRLAGQHYEYLRRQIYDTVDGRRPNMRGDHAKLLSGLDRQDIGGIADYLSRLLPAAAGPHQANEGAEP